MSDGPIYRVRFDVEVDPDVWFQLSTVADLPANVSDSGLDDLLRALRNEAVVVVDGSLLIEPASK